MSSDIRDLRDTIIPRSDQINADQLLGGPMTIRVTAVKRGSDDQPIVIHYDNDGGRPYKPCKSMRKVLIFAWKEDGSQWVGRMMTLYNLRTVKWAGVEVGGIRISHLSHIDADIKLSLAATRGKKEPIIIKRLDSSDPTVAARSALEAAARAGMESLKAAWAGLDRQQQTAIGGGKGCPESYKKTAEEADAKKKSEPEPLKDTVSEFSEDAVPAEEVPASKVKEDF